LQQQPDRLGVADADRGGQRGGLAYVVRVLEGQPQALVTIVAKAGQVQIVVGRCGAAAEQQPG
jgi:hypothetical protein